MAEKNLFQEMLENNPYLSMTDDNPFIAMWKNNPVLSVSDNNPYLAMMKNNPYLSANEGNPLTAMMRDMTGGLAGEDNPFWAMWRDWSSVVAGGNTVASMMENAPFLNLYNNWQQTMAKSWDMWLVGLGSLNWTQNQLENATKKQLSEFKAVREDLTKLAGDLSKQAAKNQTTILQALEDAVINEQD